MDAAAGTASAGGTVAALASHIQNMYNEVDMPLERFKADGLLFNSNFLDATSQAGVSAYRGELVLIEGEIGDAKGHSKPPVEVMRGAVLLADDKLKLLIGAVDEVTSLTTLVDKYSADLSPYMKAVLYVVNLKDPVQVALDGVTFTLIPLVQGVPWNEIIDELALEKSDFKGQSAADKVLTLFNEMQSYQPKYPLVSLDEALANTTDAKREAWGAV